eukprot:9352261-Pyramimonas_sp.AAC.1
MERDNGCTRISSCSSHVDSVAGVVQGIFLSSNDGLVSPLHTIEQVTRRHTQSNHAVRNAAWSLTGRRSPPARHLSCVLITTATLCHHRIENREYYNPKNWAELPDATYRQSYAVAQMLDSGRYNVMCFWLRQGSGVFRSLKTPGCGIHTKIRFGGSAGRSRGYPR